ncbi:MAG: cation diffusion facilitator family transporter [Gammaproteobacteria bacterium]|nr:cation diffusion facilitator family transporter [Gammaproteobacteria bacterium]
MAQNLEQRTKEINRVTWWGVLVNLVLSIVKLVGGVIGQSQSLIADGLHSLSDLISDGMVLVAAKHAGEEADEDHPYGHGRFETLATVALGMFLIVVAVGLAYDAALRVFDKEVQAVPHFFTLGIALFSILSKEAMYHVTHRVGVRINSKMVIANAWHHRSDSISSVVVLIGIAGAQMGVPILDPIAAIIVAVMIAKIGYDLGYHSARELVDTALDPETVEQIKSKILENEEVLELHMLRTRRMGHTSLVDVHILVHPKLSVSEGHHISEAIETSLIKSFEDINDVTVHIDPENDECEARCRNLPLRSELIIALKHAWSQYSELDAIDDITLHYLDGRITVEANIPLTVLDSLQDAERFQANFRKASLAVASVGEADLRFH